MCGIQHSPIATSQELLALRGLIGPLLITVRHAHKVRPNYECLYSSHGGMITYANVCSVIFKCQISIYVHYHKSIM